MPQRPDDAFNLLPSVRKGGQKETALLERTVSEVYNSQTKAVSEIDRLVSKGSWGRGMQDWINNGFQGTPSAASIDEYENVLSIIRTPVYAELVESSQLTKNIVEKNKVIKPKNRLLNLYIFKL